jgi:hypothetical protein
MRTGEGVIRAGVFSLLAAGLLALLATTQACRDEPTIEFRNNTSNAVVLVIDGECDRIESQASIDLSSGPGTVNFTVMTPSGDVILYRETTTEELESQDNEVVIESDVVDPALFHRNPFNGPCPQSRMRDFD